MEPISYEVIDAGGTPAGTVDLSTRVFATAVSESLVHSTVVWQLAKRRAGTHSALERSQMKGGGKKPFRQKGTGRARAGSSISPLWVGGAVVHGPRPRSYETRLNKRVRLAALTGVLTNAVESKRLLVVDSLASCQGKTKQGASLLRSVGVTKGSTLVILAREEAASALSFRNIEGVTVLGLEGVNVYDMVRHSRVVISKETIKRLEAEIERRLKSRTEEIEK